MREQVNSPLAVFWFVFVPVMVLAIVTWLLIPLVQRSRRIRRHNQAVAARRQSQTLRGRNYR